jgi:hypothetical protein
MVLFTRTHFSIRICQLRYVLENLISFSDTKQFVMRVSEVYDESNHFHFPLLNMMIKYGLRLFARSLEAGMSLRPHAPASSHRLAISP